MTFNFREYEELIREVDKLSNALSSTHKKHIACKKGCDLCCMNYKILPVEYFALKQALKNKPVDLQPSINNSCIFLKNHICQVYNSRPIICRTHGLPLLFMNEDQWELSACELNFKEFSDEDFTPENTFPQDTFNSKLFLVNQSFIKENKLPYTNFDLLEISSLREE